MNGLHFLAAIDINQVMDHSRPIEERFAQGMQTLGLGMGIIFAVLIIIWAACELLHYALHRDTASDATPAETAPAPAPMVSAPETADSQELIAVITAAIAAMLDQPTSAFRVVSFRRSSDAGAWNRK